LLSQILILQP